MKPDFLKIQKNLLGLGVLLVLFLLVLMLARVAQKPVTKKPVEKGKAVLSLKSPTQIVKMEEKFSLDVVLSTNGEKITAADSYLTYDPEKLEVLSITAGKNFASFPNLKVKKLGELLVSGLNNNQAEFAKSGIFATIELKAISAGKTSVSLSKKSVAGFEGRNVLDLSKLIGLTLEVK